MACKIAIPDYQVSAFPNYSRRRNPGTGEDRLGLQMADNVECNHQLSLEMAVVRFKRGQCPGCGKGLGESRGLEYRPRFEDIYCHTCKRAWPSQMDVDYLEDQVAAILASREAAADLDTDVTPMEFSGPSEAVSPRREAAPPLARVFSGFSNLLGGVLRRR